MAFKVHIEEAIKKLQIERERAVVATREKVTREQIIPFNLEIDKARDSAIAQRTEELNAEIKAKQEAFAQERQSFIDSAEKKKADNSKMLLETENAIVVSEYDKLIAKLRELVEEVKE